MGVTSRPRGKSNQQPRLDRLLPWHIRAGNAVRVHIVANRLPSEIASLYQPLRRVTKQEGQPTLHPARRVGKPTHKMPRTDRTIPPQRFNASSASRRQPLIWILIQVFLGHLDLSVSQCSHDMLRELQGGGEPLPLFTPSVAALRRSHRPEV